jgi:hypothetical protein
MATSYPLARSNAVVAGSESLSSLAVIERLLSIKSDVEVGEPPGRLDIIELF